MKKLRKILVALAVLALLISSVAVLVVTAEDAMEYTGSLERAQELLADVPSMDRTDSTTDLRKEAIKKVYIYLNTYPVDPETEGYDEFCAEFYAMSLKIANKYYGKLLEANTDATKQKQLGIILNYLEAYPIPEGTPDPDGDGEEYISRDALVAAVNLYNFNMANGYYTSAYNYLTAATPAVSNAAQSLKSLYTHVAKYPLDPSVEGAEDFYDKYNLLSLEIAEFVVKEFRAYKLAMEESGNAYDDREAYKAYISANLSILRDHLEACPVDLVAFPELTDRYNDIGKAINVVELDQIVFLFEDYENFVPGSDVEFPELAQAAALSKVSKALADSTIPEDTEGYADLVARIEDAETKLAAVKEARRLALAAQAKLYEYELTDNMSYKTFSSDSESMGNPNADAGEYSERVKTFDNGMSTGYEAYWRYVCLASPASPASYASLTQPNITNGFVQSFDFMIEGTNGTHYNYASFSNEWQNYKSDRLVGYEGNEFTIGYDSGTDSVYVATGNGVPSKKVKNIASEGQWFNVMITYDPVTHYGKLYIDYEYMFDIYYNGWVEGAVKMVIRCSHSSAWQNTCYDNIRFYEGTAYRDVNKFDEMSSDEQFEYYVNYFHDENAEPKSRNDAYVKAKLLIDGVKGQYSSLPEEEMTDELKHLRDLVDKMESFDYENKIVVLVREANLNEILKQVSALEEIPAYSTNVSAINSAIATLDQFIADNNDFINKADPLYNAAVARVNAVKSSLSKCESAVAFARALTQFERATTVASMTKRALAVNEVYKLARYDKPENVAAVKDDPVFLAFEQIVNGKNSSPTDPGYITAFDYYTLIPSVIAQQQKIENSNRIIKCIDLLLAMEGYENTETFWQKNYEEVEFFISIIRDIVSVDNYDASYPGIDEAIAQYELIDAYFYVLLQEDHIATIGAQLDRFALSTSYIEKIGICTYIERYFESNSDIDLSRPEIQQFLYKLERYNAELETYMDDYKELLERNTRYFIDTIQKMTLLTTYAELKPLYDEALGYYYAMNAITEEAKTAVALFDAYDKQLTAVQVNSELFLRSAVELQYVDLIGVEGEYAALSECSKYYEYVDATYSENIAPQIALYERLVASYNLAVDSANETLEGSSVVASSLRANEIPAAVLAVINQLYKN